MTGTKELLRARHAKLVKEQEQKLAEVTEAISQLQELMTEIANFEREIANFERDLDRAFNWPPDKPIRPNQSKKVDRHGRPTNYNRRPPTWKGRRGYELVSGVIAIQARGKCGVAAAIRELKKNEPEKWPEGERALQRRYQEIKGKETEGGWKRWCRIEQLLEAEAAALLAKTANL